MNKNNTNIPAEPTPEPAAVDLHIEKLLNGGDGLARHDGQAIFVPLTAPGDLVKARISKQNKNFAQAQVDEIVEPGPGRREAPCPYFGQCGGCNLQHLDWAHQQKSKTEIVADCFTRLGKLDVSGILEPCAPIGPELGYRNRIRLYASNTGPYGMMKRGTHDVVSLDQCPLMPEAFNRDIMPWLRMMPPVEQVVIRMDEAGGWVLSAYGNPARMKIMRKMVGALAEGEPPAPGCLGLLLNNRPVWGRDYLVQTVGGHKFRVGLQSFFQANLAVTEEAVSTVRQWVAEVESRGELGSLLGDLFCGVGLFSLTLSHLFKKVVAIDSDEHACRDAVNNVARDQLAKGKVTVRQGRLGEVLKDTDLASAPLWEQSFCVIDPPRTGLGEEGMKHLRELKPRHLVMMSCDPATLARDAALLVEAGYRPEKLKILDMFPQTSHIESLMLLTKQD
jgi:23S rRNA (uracil1939-C5)-methyltransferase